MGKGQPRYVQTIFSNRLHERSQTKPLILTLCGAEISNFTRCTPEDGFKMCGNCARMTANLSAKA